MHRRLLLTAMSSLSLSLAAGCVPGDLAVLAPQPTRITIESSSSEWARRIDWGLERFSEAGMTLPPISVSVHDDTASCGGESGLYRPGDPVEVHLCSPSRPDARAAKLITLHELAHAWAESQLSSDDQAAFLALRGLDAWVDRQLPAHEWGAEHAAEVVSWGLMDEAIPIVRIYDTDPAELSAAFDLLVRRSPLWAEAAPAAA